MFTKTSLILATAFSFLSFSTFAESADPNVPRSGLYKWEIKADSTDANGSVKSHGDSTGAQTNVYKSNGKEVTKSYAGGETKELCIDTSKSVPGMAGTHGCKPSGQPVRNGNVTTASSDCMGMKISTENKKISDNVYEISSVINMQGKVHKSTTVYTRVGDCKL